MSKRITSHVCAAPGCRMDTRERGRYCGTHANRLWRHGDVNVVFTQGIKMGEVPIHDLLLPVLDDKLRTVVELAAMVAKRPASVRRALTKMIGREASVTYTGSASLWTRRKTDAKAP